MIDIGKCDHCGKSFTYRLIHNGFNESAYAYCEQCGMLAMLDGWKVPEGIDLKAHQMITPDIELLLDRYTCGGQFKAGASPRCPHCDSPLSPEKATAWIEANAPGSRKGWRWQRNWTGIYAIWIEKRVMNDTWKKK